MRILKRFPFLLILVLTMFSFTVYSTNVRAELTKAENKYIQTITKDFIDTHNLNLNSYNFYDLREIYPDKDNLTTQEKSLVNIFINIVKEQDFIDCSPLLYVDETNNKGYVLEKKVSGMNNVHILSYDHTSQNWKVTNKINEMGKDLVELGLLKSAE